MEKSSKIMLTTKELKEIRKGELSSRLLLDYGISSSAEALAAIEAGEFEIEEVVPLTDGTVCGQ
jgi:hypothetical protein